MKVFSWLCRTTPRFNLSKPSSHFANFTSSPLHNLEVDSIPSNPALFLLNLCRTLRSLRKIHALLTVHGETDDPFLQTKLVGLYGTFGDIRTARLVFDEIPDPDFDSCKVMIRWYFMNDMYDEIAGFYRYMRRRFLLLDNIVLSFALKACNELRDVGEGKRLHGYIVHMGSPDNFVLTGLVDMYAKCGEIEMARKVFETILCRNVVCWTSMIVGYVQNDCANEGLLMFNRMRGCLIEGNIYTLGSVITACAKLGALHQGKWLHGVVIKNGVRVNSFWFTSLVDMYIKCGNIHDATLIFNEFPIVDLVSWTAMIVGYSKHGLAAEALMLFTDKNYIDVYPNSVTLASAVSACAILGYCNFGSSLHSLGIKLGQDDVYVMNALVDMYAKCTRIGDAANLFESITEKDVVSWNSLISGYYQNGFPYEALRLFKRMRSNYYYPDSVTIVSVLSACSSLGDIRLGFSLHGHSTRVGLLASNSVYIGTALLNLYAKCGDAKSAREVFNEMTQKNAVAWSVTIDGYGKQGHTNECVELFNKMVKENIEPTDIAFTTILSACGHTGKIREAWDFFDKMCRTYNFTPSMRHYACLVDMLARSGNLDEASEFMENMPIEPDSDVFGAFLHGCSLYCRFDLVDLAVKKMLELNTDDAGHYMLMANSKAYEGRWSQADRLRELMKIRGVKKHHGFSQKVAAAFG